jgi:hypothetical protein
MPVLRLKGPYRMAMTINPDGTATYSITVPAPLAVDRDGTTGRYAAGRSTFVYDLERGDVAAWREQIAASIAIHDRMHADADAAKQVAVEALAETLYVADVADIPEPTPFVELDDPDVRGYRRRAKRLADLGVIIDGSAQSDIAPAAGGAA